MRIQSVICQQVQRRRGLSLIEVVVSSLLTGFVIVAALRGVGGIFATWSAAERQHDAAGLARQLMTEILQQRYLEPDVPANFGRELPETSLNRLLWDDVDDYHGLSETPRDRSGFALAGYSGWTWSATVEWVNVTSPQNSSVSDQGLVRITVTVTEPAGRQTILVGHRSQWGLMEQTPEATQTSQLWAASQLRVGTGRDLRSATNLFNAAQDQ